MAVKKSLVEMAEEPPASFPVTVEAVIGHIDMGRGSKHPLEAGMALVARYHREMRDNGGDPGDHVYRFPGWKDGETVVVNICSEIPTRVRDAESLDVGRV